MSWRSSLEAELEEEQSAELAEHVIDEKEKEACDINNKGFNAQVEYLKSRGWTQKKIDSVL